MALTLLSIQSHVVYGHVGNSAAVFPLQRLGCEVWPLHTVQFSSHAGYSGWRGRAFEAAMIDDCVAGLAGGRRARTLRRRAVGLSRPRRNRRGGFARRRGGPRRQSRAPPIAAILSSAMKDEVSTSSPPSPTSSPTARCRRRRWRPPTPSNSLGCLAARSATPRSAPGDRHPSRRWARALSSPRRSSSPTRRPARST